MFKGTERGRVDNVETQEDRALLQDLLTKRRQYRKAQALWSGCFHASIFVVPAASLTTTILVALKFQAIATTIVSATVTFSVAIASAGRFREKWINVRTSRGSIESLIVDLNDPAADRSVIRSSFKEVIRNEDAAVLRDGVQAN